MCAQLEGGGFHGFGSIQVKEVAGNSANYNASRTVLGKSDARWPAGELFFRDTYGIIH